MSVKDKMCSGRYFLTIVCGIAFLYAVIKALLPPEAVVAVISMVFISYFQKKGHE